MAQDRPRLAICVLVATVVALSLGDWGWMLFDEGVDLRTTFAIVMIVAAGMLALNSGKSASGRAGQSGT